MTILHPTSQRPRAALAILVLAALLSGCEQMPVARYSASADAIVALQPLRGKTVAVGKFESARDIGSKIVCLRDGVRREISTPDGQAFSEYVRSALINDLRLSNMYSQSATLTISGRLSRVEMKFLASASQGEWNIELELSSSNGKQLRVKQQTLVEYLYPSSTCPRLAEAYMPAVRSLLLKVVTSPEFSGLIAN